MFSGYVEHGSHGHLSLHLLCDLLDLGLAVHAEQVQLFVYELHAVLPVLPGLHAVDPVTLFHFNSNLRESLIEILFLLYKHPPVYFKEHIYSRTLYHIMATQDCGVYRLYKD